MEHFAAGSLRTGFKFSVCSGTSGEVLEPTVVLHP